MSNINLEFLIAADYYPCIIGLSVIALDHTLEIRVNSEKIIL